MWPCRCSGMLDHGKEERERSLSNSVYLCILQNTHTIASFSPMREDDAAPNLVQTYWFEIMPLPPPPAVRRPRRIDWEMDVFEWGGIFHINFLFLELFHFYSRFHFLLVSFKEELFGHWSHQLCPFYIFGWVEMRGTKTTTERSNPARSLILCSRICPTKLTHFDETTGNTPPGWVRWCLLAMRE